MIVWAFLFLGENISALFQNNCKLLKSAKMAEVGRFSVIVNLENNFRVLHRLISSDSLSNTCVITDGFYCKLEYPICRGSGNSGNVLDCD